MAGVISFAQDSITPLFDIISTVITVIGGYFLYQTGEVAKNILNGKNGESSGANRIFENYGYYLQITGVLFIIGIVVIIFIFMTY